MMIDDGVTLQHLNGRFAELELVARASGTSNRLFLWSRLQHHHVSVSLWKRLRWHLHSDHGQHWRSTQVDGTGARLVDEKSSRAELVVSMDRLEGSCVVSFVDRRAP